ncbi:tyrosyl-tRNA synthetase [Xylariaceae sp. FL0255]|nr:tyrosyl-tRNA synthetase [Xylariaceae sp. FL0255]
MDPPKTPEERFALINENLAEFLDPQWIQDILNEGRNPKVYWGTATTGRPHCGYLVPGVKIAQLLAASCEMNILLADVHGFLDNLKAPLELVAHRANYYRFAITALLQACGVSTEKVKFTLGSSYQTSHAYTMDMYKLSALVTEKTAKKAGAAIVKQTDDALVSGLLYPLLQVLDEQYLDVDAQFGGVDQRKLFVAAKEWLPKLGYRQRAHLMNEMIPGLQGGKMSSSDENSKIDLLDPPEVVTKKINKALVEPKKVEENGLLGYVEHVFLPVAELKGKREFVVLRERDGLEPLVYTKIDQLRADYQNDVLTPQLLKPAVTKALTDIMKPIQEAYLASKEWQEITLLAYPPKEKKVKAKKDKGSRHPGAMARAAVAAVNPESAADIAALEIEEKEIQEKGS